MRISDWSSDVCSSDLDVDQPVELRLCGVGDQVRVAVSGIVDEVIKCIALPSLRERRTQPIHKGRKSRDVAGVQLKRDCPAAHCPNLFNDRLGLVRTAVVGDDDVAATAGEAEGGVAAEAAAGAGYESDPGHGGLLLLTWPS